MPTGRSIRLAITTLCFAGLVVALNAVTVAATPGHNFTATLLGRGTDQSEGTLPMRQGLDFVVTQNTVLANGRSGWHSHPGGAMVVVAEGEITTYRSVGNGCEVTLYTKGQAFLERPGQPLNAVNTGTTTTIVIATFPNVPVGGSTKIDLPDPGTCVLPSE